MSFTYFVVINESRKNRFSFKNKQNAINKLNDLQKDDCTFSLEEINIKRGDYIVDTKSIWYFFDGKKFLVIDEPINGMGLAYHVIDCMKDLKSKMICARRLIG